MSSYFMNMDGFRNTIQNFPRIDYNLLTADISPVLTSLYSEAAEYKEAL